MEIFSFSLLHNERNSKKKLKEMSQDVFLFYHARHPLFIIMKANLRLVPHSFLTLFSSFHLSCCCILKFIIFVFFVCLSWRSGRRKESTTIEAFWSRKFLIDLENNSEILISIESRKLIKQILIGRIGEERNVFESRK